MSPDFEDWTGKLVESCSSAYPNIIGPQKVISDNGITIKIKSLKYELVKKSFKLAGEQKATKADQTVVEQRESRKREVESRRIERRDFIIQHKLTPKELRDVTGCTKGAAYQWLYGTSGINKRNFDLIVEYVKKKK